MNTWPNIMMALPIVLVAAVGCGPAVYQSAANPRSAIEAADVSTGTADRILARDLRDVQGNTAADAVRHLRPVFMRAAGRPTSPATASVYVNGRYAGGLDVLDLVPLSLVSEIRHVGQVTAKSMFGSYCRCEGGVILVRTRVSGRIAR